MKTVITLALAAGALALSGPSLAQPYDHHDRYDHRDRDYGDYRDRYRDREHSDDWWWRNHHQHRQLVCHWRYHHRVCFYRYWR